MQVKFNGKVLEAQSTYREVVGMRGSKRDAIKLSFNMSYDEFKKLNIRDDVKWSIFDETSGDDGKSKIVELDYSNFNLLGDVVIHSDKKISFFMLKSTNAELLEQVVNDLLEA